MESREKITLIILVVITVVSSAQGGTCPYSSFSDKHSFCLNPNPTCSIIKEGVNKQDIKAILKTHNKLRSRVASGHEKRAGGLPTAANMLQLEWDNELSAIAQKWASQCTFKHDCNDCRKVERFAVGQNIGYEERTCSSDGCIHNATTPDWKGTIQAFYEEVNLFNKDKINAYTKADKKYGHFSQVIWATTWKVGCGFVAYKEEGAYKKLYVCDYGPTGNFYGKPLYKTGEKCSACPSNTCCGTCKVRGPHYKGLCKVTNLSEGPKE